jgi:hypothetical protein
METKQITPDFLNQIKEFVENNIDTNNKQLLLKLNSSSTSNTIEIVKIETPSEKLSSYNDGFIDAWELSSKLSQCNNLGKAIFYVLLKYKAVYPEEFGRHFIVNPGSVSYEIKKLVEVGVVEEIDNINDQDVQYIINRFSGGTNAPGKSMRFYRRSKGFSDRFEEFIPQIKDLLKGLINDSVIINKLDSFDHKKQFARHGTEDERIEKLKKAKEAQQKEEEERFQKAEILDKQLQEFYWSKLEDKNTRTPLVKGINELNEVASEAPKEISSKLYSFHRFQDLKEKVKKLEAENVNK